MNNTGRGFLFRLGAPLSPVYAFIMRMRSRAYASGLFTSCGVSRPVICVGNISMGGTGKTPHVIWLCRKLARAGIRPAVVSRGYGGRAGKGPLVISNGTGPKVGPQIAGDEPVMIAGRLAGVPVVVGSDRVASARLAISRLGAEVIVLDDGFQHLRLRRDMDIVLIAANGSPLRKKVFPGGELREPIDALCRASCVLVTRAECISLDEQRDFVRKLGPGLCNKPVFFSRNRVSGIRPLQEKENRKSAAPRTAFAFCGLGDPDSFLGTLKTGGINVAGHRWFADHHKYANRDLCNLAVQAQKAGADTLVTTAKDAVKLAGLDTGNIPVKIHVIEIEPSVDRGLWGLIDDTLKKRKEGQRTTDRKVISG